MRPVTHWRRVVMKCPVVVLICLLTAEIAFAQTESARISGRVTDVTGAVLVGAVCKVTNIETNVSITTITNQDGIYVLPDLHPATYRLTVQKEGFRTVVQSSLQLYVQDAVNENFTLDIGPSSESVTVAAPLIQTDSASVSTIVDDQFVQNIPLNGRSFQSLIALTPGVVFTSQNLGEGQFSVNGQRSDANYFMVDGVSANFGVTVSGLGETLAGAIPGFTATRTRLQYCPVRSGITGLKISLPDSEPPSKSLRKQWCEEGSASSMIWATGTSALLLSGSHTCTPDLFPLLRRCLSTSPTQLSSLRRSRRQSMAAYMTSVLSIRTCAFHSPCSGMRPSNVNWERNKP